MADNNFQNSEASLRSSNTLLRIAGEIAKFGGWVVDLRDPDDRSRQVPTNKMVVHWSDVVSDMHGTPRGYSPTVEEALGYYAPEWRERIRFVFNACVNEGVPFDEEMEIITIGGDRRWIRTIGEVVRENGKIVKVQGAFQDISRIKKAETEIRESQEIFHDIFRKHIAVKLIIDPESGDILEANKAAARFYGWTREELTKMNVFQLSVHPVAEIKKEIRRVTDAEKNYFIFRNRTASGQIKDVEVYTCKIRSGGKVFLHSIIHDITAKENAERELRLLSRSVEQSPISIIITGIDGSFEYVNPHFETTTGYSLEELRGESPRILKSGHHSREFYRDIWDTILSGRDWTGELKNKKKNGEFYWIWAIISPVINEQGEVTNFVSMSENITERKKMVEDLMAAKEKAEESDRLKSAFLANMSHEIRTPMNGILGFTRILRAPGLTRREQQKFLGIIENSGKRMLDTVNDLIDISKIDAGQVKVHISDTNIKEQLESLFRFFKHQADHKDVQFLLNDPVPSSIAVVRTDRSKLNSILTNLIRNAIKFTEKGKIEIGCIPKGSSLEYYVRDSGAGISRKFQAVIFNRFERASIKDNSGFQGTGLGLAITKSYIEMLGGEIWVESDKGKGSTFYFRIPLKKTGSRIRSSPLKKSSPGSGIPRLKGKRILISEDDNYSMQMIVFLVRKTGAEISVAADGIESVREFQRKGADLLLLDIQMPELDGYEVLEHIRSVKPDLPVIAQTAYAMPEDITKFKQAGFTDYLTKPVDQDKLYRLLDRYLGAENEYPASAE